MLGNCFGLNPAIFTEHFRQINFNCLAIGRRRFATEPLDGRAWQAMAYNNN